MALQMSRRVQRNLVMALGESGPGSAIQSLSNGLRQLALAERLVQQQHAGVEPAVVDDGILGIARS